MSKRKSAHQGQSTQGAATPVTPSAQPAAAPASRWKDPNTYIAIGTLALALIGLGALWVSRDSEERQLRAYVTVTDFGVVCQTCGDVELKLPGLQGVSSALMMRIENSGETPASHIKPTFNWWPVKRPGTALPANFTFPDLWVPDSKHVSSVSELGKDKHGDAAAPLTQGGIAVLKEGGAGFATVFLYGHVDYCDVFGNPHSTAYCFEYERGLGDSLPKCGTFNGEMAPRATCPKPQR